MNMDPLFRKFDELADAHERIPAIRKVILTYILYSAVNATDAKETAEKLRATHDSQRRRLLKTINRKEIPRFADLVNEDLPSSLSGIPIFLFDRLANVASIEKGLTQIQRSTPGKYPLVVTAEVRSSSNSYEFEGPAAIIPLVSSTGHGDASLKRLHYQEGQYAVGNILAVVQPICPDLLRARFIYEYLSAFKEELLVSRMVGTANVSLTVNKLKEVPVPLVSGPLLSRIDELMALCDQLEAQLEERQKQHASLARASLARFEEAPTPENLTFLFHKSYDISPADLRKTILTLAVRGQLVPQDPKDDPADQFLAFVQDAAATKIGYRRRSNSEDDDNPKFTAHVPDEIPPGWSVCPLEELFRFIDYRGRTPVRSSSGIRLITAKNVKKGFVANEPIEFIDEALYEKWMTRGFPKSGDLLFVTEGHTMGFVGVLNFEFKYALAQRTINFQPFCDGYSHFYLLYLLSDPFQTAIVNNATGSAAQGIKAAKLKRIRVIVPPLAEQHRIVAKVKQLMAFVDQLEKQLADSRVLGEKLLEAIVSELTKAEEREPAPTAS